MYRSNHYCKTMMVITVYDGIRIEEFINGSLMIFARIIVENIRICFFLFFVFFFFILKEVFYEEKRIKLTCHPGL